MWLGRLYFYYNQHWSKLHQAPRYSTIECNWYYSPNSWWNRVITRSEAVGVTGSGFREKSCDISVQFPEHEGEDTASLVVGGVPNVSPRAQPSAACSPPDQSLQKTDEEIKSDASRFASTHVTCIGVSSPSLLAKPSSCWCLNWQEERDKRKTSGTNRWRRSERAARQTVPVLISLGQDHHC